MTYIVTFAADDGEWCESVTVESPCIDAAVLDALKKTNEIHRDPWSYSERDILSIIRV